MRVGLFIPCYVDQFYPRVGVASLQLLEALGVTVEFPLQQTCCGQPMANAGYQKLSKKCDAVFVENFAAYDYIVGPSGSCVLHIKEHLKNEQQPEAAAHIRANTYELCEFLTDILKVQSLPSSFTAKVGLHQGCHGLRGLHLGKASELVATPFSKQLQLLNMVKGVEITELERADECCGFGGTFCVSEEAVSVAMGKRRMIDHLQHGAQYITSSDMSCLMHLEGIIKQQQQPIEVLHIAEILAGGLAVS